MICSSCGEEGPQTFFGVCQKCFKGVFDKVVTEVTEKQKDDKDEKEQFRNS